MPFPRIGLGGVLTFNEKPAVRSMGRAKHAFGGFSRTSAQVPVATGVASKGLFGLRTSLAGVTKQAVAATTAMGGMSSGALGLGRSLKTAGLIGLAVGGALAFKKMVGVAARFEQSMADLGAVARASSTEMAALEKRAKEMGIVSEFSASQSAEAMKMLKMAGAGTQETIDGIKGVLDAASAGSIGYAESASIVATITRGMGREFNQATNLADILALASTKANVTMLDLGESFRYGMAQARIMGISTEELTAIFGKLGDAGLRGSMGGTALTSMLVKLAKPSGTAQKLMDQWGVSLTDATGRMLPLSTIIDQFSQRLGNVQDAGERASKMTELFGIRGQKAYAALAAAGKQSLDVLTGELQKASDGIGAAAEMADRRLDTLTGRMKMLGATMEGFAIEMAKPAVTGLKKFVKNATDGLNNVLLVMQELREEQKKGMSTTAAAAKLSKKYGKDTVGSVMMIEGALSILNLAWEGVKWVVKTAWAAIDATVGEFVRGFASQIAPITDAAKSIKSALTEVFDALFGWLGDSTKETTKGMKAEFRSFGSAVGAILTRITVGLAFILHSLLQIIRKSRTDLQKGMASIEIQAAKTLRWYGIISAKEADRRIRSAKRITREIGEEERKTRDAYHKTLEALNRLITGKTKLEAAPAKAAEGAAGAAKAAAEAARIKPELNVNLQNEVSIDGRKVGGALARHQQQIQERAGWKSTNWQPGRLILEHGAMPATVTVRGGG